jgi:hypothetical protein
VREEQPGEHKTGYGAVEEKIVPLDRGADRGCDHGAAKLKLMLLCGEGNGVDIG